ncbi:3-phosphoinositide-dependent protein kinase 1 isoform X2 [Planococcus citri]|uniref:3-phosphoinositide-dependent protein kinase 1 isoform X2 n=1 Tax=Planococcus citri TaxID=170843 RepID=UPI0031F9C124
MTGIRSLKKYSQEKFIPIIRMAPLSPMSENEAVLKKTTCCNGTAATTMVSPTSTPSATAVVPTTAIPTTPSATAATTVTSTNTAHTHTPSKTTTTTAAPATATATPTMPPTKRTPNDFVFGKVIGEGSYSTVYLTRDIHTQKLFAIKVCEKQHIIREKKTEYVKREKDILYYLSNTPFIVKLFYTFQDVDRLYFVLSYAKNGELLPYINKVGSFDMDCTKFYSGEILAALEYLHNANVIHRDLKPENILLDENMHIMITDFGSATMCKPPRKNGMSNGCGRGDDDDDDEEDEPRKRKNSFVGTAQYVSPELLTDKPVSPSSDLWAFGCIIYQMIAGLPPFRSRSEYIIFQKITKLEYEFPDGFCEKARDLVEKLLVLDSDERLGARDTTRYSSIRSHPFYEGLDFETLQDTTPPQIYPYLPGRDSDSQELRSHYRVPDNLEPGLNEKQLTRLLGLDIRWAEPEQPPQTVRPRKKSGVMDLNAEEIKEQLEQQKRSSKWDSMVQGNLILKQGLIDKRKGLFSKRRMLLLTMGPHLYYADPVTHTLKGEIPWSPELRIEPKNFKTFFVHTPNRTYYLEDPEGYALDWCKAIEEVRITTYGADNT